MALSPLQDEVLTVLRDAHAPVNTTQVRQLLNRHRTRPLVAERVYQALLTLQRYGLVCRVYLPATRNVYWEPVTERVHGLRRGRPGA